MYQTAWIALKQSSTNTITIAAPPNFHARIYKAVMKEKYMDTLFHLATEEQGKKTSLSSTSTDNILTITLHYYTPIEHLFS